MFAPAAAPAEGGCCAARGCSAEKQAACSAEKKAACAAASACTDVEECCQSKPAGEKPFPIAHNKGAKPIAVDLTGTSRDPAAFALIAFYARNMFNLTMLPPLVYFVLALASVDGKTKYICACGQSKNFPYCDGSHRAYNAEHGTSVGPTVVSKESTGKDTVWVCACGEAKGRVDGNPMCDGSHRKLPENQKPAEPAAAVPAATAAAPVAEAAPTAEAAAEPVVEASAEPVAEVASPAAAAEPAAVAERTAPVEAAVEPAAEAAAPAADAAAEAAAEPAVAVDSDAAESQPEGSDKPAASMLSSSYVEVKPDEE
jgi:CDGSH-type Zn-finger protein